MTNELCKLQVMGKGGILGGARLRNGLEPFAGRLRVSVVQCLAMLLAAEP